MVKDKEINPITITTIITIEVKTEGKIIITTIKIIITEIMVTSLNIITVTEDLTITITTTTEEVTTKIIITIINHQTNNKIST